MKAYTVKVVVEGEDTYEAVMADSGREARNDTARWMNLTRGHSVDWYVSTAREATEAERYMARQNEIAEMSFSFL